MTEPIARIEAALTRLGAEHEPPPGWEARVLAATAAQKRRPWWLFPLPVAMFAAIGAAAAFMFWPRAFEVAHSYQAPASDEMRAVRSDDERHINGTEHIEIKGGGKYRALWVHRDDELVLACPGDARCTGDTEADLKLDRVGSYTVTAWTSDREIPKPAASGTSFSRDKSAALEARATEKHYAFKVH